MSVENNSEKTAGDSGTSMSATRVLVTGASGFIASHVVQQLLQKGFLVRGTVRSLTNPLKVDPIKQLDQEGTRLELVEADLSNEECWKDAVEGCTYVYHTASPFPMHEPSNQDEVIKPAVDGTLNVLKACAGKVKRVVLTSSIAAIGEHHCPDKRLTEADWTDLTQPGLVAYSKSKVLAEKAAWDYVKDLEDDQKFELATVNPAFVMGPVLTQAGGTSIDTVCRFLSGKDPALPRVNLTCVDVRDVARGHIAAMTVPEAAGHRHILADGSCWMVEMTKTLKEEFGAQGYSPSTRQLPYFMAWMVSFFDPAIRLIRDRWGVVTPLDNTRMREVLGIEPIPWRQSLIEMAYSLIENGKIPKKKKYKGKTEAAAEYAPQAAPEASQETAPGPEPKAEPEASKETAPGPEPEAPRETAPGPEPEAAPEASQETSPEAAPKSEPEAAPEEPKQGETSGEAEPKESETS